MALPDFVCPKTLPNRCWPRRCPRAIQVQGLKAASFFQLMDQSQDVCAGRKENITKPIHFSTWFHCSNLYHYGSCATPKIFQDVPILEEANIEPIRCTGLIYGGTIPFYMCGRKRKPNSPLFTSLIWYGDDRDHCTRP